MHTFTCPKGCGFTSTQPLPNTSVAHPCPKRRQGDRFLVWLDALTDDQAHELDASTRSVPAYA